MKHLISTISLCLCLSLTFSSCAQKIRVATQHCAQIPELPKELQQKRKTDALDRTLQNFNDYMNNN